MMIMNMNILLSYTVDYRQIAGNRVQYNANKWEIAMKKVRDIYRRIKNVSADIAENHMGAYAAQTAYFFMLCMIPIILLLLTMVQYTPVTKADVMTAVIQVFPASVDSLITSIVNQVYNQSTGIIPITIIVALWSAGHPDSIVSMDAERPVIIFFSV